MCDQSLTPSSATLRLRVKSRTQRRKGAETQRLNKLLDRLSCCICLGLCVFMVKLAIAKIAVYAGGEYILQNSEESPSRMQHPPEKKSKGAFMHLTLVYRRVLSLSAGCLPLRVAGGRAYHFPSQSHELPSQEPLPRSSSRDLPLL